MNTSPKIRIALVEDHKIVRRGLVELITGFPEFEVVMEAGHGKELIEGLTGASVLPDVVVLDINMPVMNGYDTAALLRKQWPEIRILALSMLSEEFPVIKMLRSGAQGFITKDCDPIELRTALNDVYRNCDHFSGVSGRSLHAVREGEGDKNITDKEMEFLKLCCSDLSYKEIGRKMNLSGRTVEGYRDILFYKLNVRTRISLVLFAVNNGIVLADS
jgi:DNA-binding NarL/FixJ family response regulator